eukprot:1937294-Rhodomonas_salina.1
MLLNSQWCSANAFHSHLHWNVLANAKGKQACTDFHIGCAGQSLLAFSLLFFKGYFIGHWMTGAAFKLPLSLCSQLSESPRQFAMYFVFVSTPPHFQLSTLEHALAEGS